MSARKSTTVRRRVTDIRMNFASALRSANWKYDAATLKAMIVERTAADSGKTEVITFHQASRELTAWFDTGKLFANISEDGFTDCLAAMFFQGSTIHTAKAHYRLWARKGH